MYCSNMIYLKNLRDVSPCFLLIGRSSSADAAIVGGSLQETEAEINSRGGKGIAVVCDHSDDKQVKNVFTKIQKDHGKLDILVNNAYSAVNVSIGKYLLKIVNVEVTPNVYWAVNVSIAKY